jgi:hypothetical protein
VIAELQTWYAEREKARAKERSDPNPMLTDTHPDTLSRMLRKLRIANKWKKPYGMNSLRRAFMFECLEKNIPIATVAGVAGTSPDTIARHYANLEKLKNTAVTEIYPMAKLRNLGKPIQQVPRKPNKANAKTNTKKRA